MKKIAWASALIFVGMSVSWLIGPRPTHAATAQPAVRELESDELAAALTVYDDSLKLYEKGLGDDSSWDIALERVMRLEWDGAADRRHVIDVETKRVDALEDMVKKRFAAGIASQRSVDIAHYFRAVLRTRQAQLAN